MVANLKSFIRLMLSGFLVTSVIVLSSCQNISYITETNATDYNDTACSEKEPTFDITINDITQIKQWALDNDGSYNTFIYDDNSWAFDTKLAIEDVDINLPEARDIFNPVRKVIIAVIDTSVDVSDSSIVSNVWYNIDEIPDDRIDNDNNGYVDDVVGWNFCDNNNVLYDAQIDSDLHGTHIVGCLCGFDKKTDFSGVLAQTNIKVMCLKALDGPKEEGSIDNIITAINYAENNGAKICCLSFATYLYNDSLLNTMYNSEMLFVVAAGNDGVSLTNDLSVYPASYNLKNMISVADLRSDGNLSCTSNYGNDVDIAAPGTDIVSTIPKGKFGLLCGTSCAVPYVAGGAALAYCQSNNLMSAEEMKCAILQNSKIIESLKNKTACGGMIDIYKLLSFCQNN